MKDMKLYLMKFRSGEDIHIGLSMMSTRKEDYGTFFRPYAPCRDTARSHAYPISKEIDINIAKEKVTCDICKKTIKNLTKKK